VDLSGFEYHYLEIWRRRAKFPFALGPKHSFGGPVHHHSLSWIGAITSTSDKIMIVLLAQTSILSEMLL
jgi:hypothetical protein